MTKPTQIYPSEIENLFVLRRKSDGKFYRGAKWWKWTKRWRGAAVLTKGFWNTFVIPLIKDDVELLDIREVIHKTFYEAEHSSGG